MRSRLNGRKWTMWLLAASVVTICVTMTAIGGAVSANAINRSKTRTPLKYEADVKRIVNEERGGYELPRIPVLAQDR